ncbi:hypothetical protein TNCT_736841 [Trichonephila clavata]|uniref:Uncharacterized protein n=1 Tax=Trichonephila clavata TaxID=2740835 RepID=A0A8X6KCE1_TRICU|nr:hypothetical protein TNCT_736841 [Trichonephila clavata]
MCWGLEQKWRNKPQWTKQRRLLHCLRSRLIYLKFQRKLKVQSEFGMGDTVTIDSLEIHLAIDHQTVPSSFVASDLVYHRPIVIRSKVLFCGVPNPQIRKTSDRTAFFFIYLLPTVKR